MDVIDELSLVDDSEADPQRMASNMRKNEGKAQDHNDPPSPSKCPRVRGALQPHERGDREASQHSDRLVRKLQRDVVAHRAIQREFGRLEIERVIRASAAVWPQVVDVHSVEVDAALSKLTSVLAGALRPFAELVANEVRGSGGDDQRTRCPIRSLRRTNRLDRPLSLSRRILTARCGLVERGCGSLCVAASA